MDLPDRIVEDHPGDVDVEADALTAAFAPDVLDAVANLQEVERQVVGYRYGLGSNAPLTLRETADRMGRSFAGVRKIEERALDRLRVVLDAD